MADQTVLATSDVQIDTGANNEGNSTLFMKARAPNEANLFFRFDVSSLAGKMWDSVVFRATYSTTQISFSGAVVFLARVLQDMNYGNVTSVIFDVASWNTVFAEDSTDNDHSTRVDIGGALDSGQRVDGDTLTSNDITDLVKDGINETSGIFDLIMYSDTTAVTTSMQLHAIEGTGTQPSLFFTNVEDMESTTSGGGGATNVAVPSASVLSQSGRPPIAGADRQVSATIIHDGVEPMTILSMTLKGEFSTEN